MRPRCEDNIDKAATHIPCSRESGNMQQAPKGFILSVRCLITFTLGGTPQGRILIHER